MVQGKVTGTNGDPLAFAVVYVSDAAGSPVGNISESTDLDGSYTLAAASGQFISCSYVGYTRLTQQAQTSVLDFAMDGGTTTLPVFELIDSKVKKTAIWVVIGMAVLASFKG